MRRTVIGTFDQCMTVLKKNKRLGEHGYTHYELHETTPEEFKLLDKRNHINLVSYYQYVHFSKFFKIRNIGELFTLYLYRD